MLVLALFNALAPIVLFAVQYSHFSAMGALVTDFGGVFSIWLFPTIVLVSAAAVISRKTYGETNSPYLAGLVNAAVVSLIAASNTLEATF